jgi:hypothetical protein
MKQIEPDFWAFRGRYSRTACRSARTDRSPISGVSGGAEKREETPSK